MVTQEITPPQTVEQLLIDLHQRQVKLWVENGRLYSQTAAGGIPPTLRTQIQQRKAEIIAFLTAAQSVGLPANGHGPALAPLERPQLLPLSFAQRRLWFLDQLEGGANPTYIIPAAYRLSGALQVDRLEQALNVLVQRHEVLRTNFPATAGEPSQQIHAARTLALPVIDLSHLLAHDQRAELEQRQRAAIVQPFDLVADCLVRTTLYRCGLTEHVLLLTLHHIIADGWSLQRLWMELATLYTALTAEQASPLLPLPLQYADYALWQQQWLQTGDSGSPLATQSAYWQRQLANVPTLLELPTDQPRPAVQRFQGASERFVIDAHLTAQVRRVSRQHETTLFMTLLTAFAVQLARYSGQDQLVIGTPVANRQHPDIEALIGFFVNTLALRIDLQDAAAQPLSFAALLAQVRQTALAAFAHQDLPFEQVIQELGIPRHLSHAPLVQVMFALENHQPDLPTLGAVQVEPLTLPSQGAKFDLSLVLEESATTLTGQLEYNTDLFTAATIRRMVGHFQTLLGGIVADPTQAIHQLPLLTAAERQQVLVDWNDTPTAYPQHRCIQHLFEEQVQRTPDALAVISHQSAASNPKLARNDSATADFGLLAADALTYAELNARANQLAHHLQNLGVGPESLVGLCVDRSIEMVVGLLGILKAGGAYVPLDPAYPQERLAFILQDAAPAIVVTQVQHRGQISPNTPLVCLDADATQIGQHPRRNPDVALHNSNLAYVIYTSGSTGQPKGVLLQHDGLVNLAQAQIGAFGVQSGHRVLQVASLNFDASISEIVMALCAGATLIVAPTAALLPGPALTQTLQQQVVTHATLVPTAVALLDPTQLPALQTLIVAGEACPPALAARWSQGRTFFNAYGPTETTVCATIMDCAGWHDREQSPPIGRPIANVQVYLLDRHHNPVPIGVPGELYIGGVAVARGYLQRPELTHEKFIASPFGPGRLYKTGDLARWLPNGTLEYLGRSDHQVKLRGFRIELGEIEAALSAHPAVQEAVVIVHTDTSGEKRLVAYMVTSNKVTVTLSALREYLQKKLPDYMVPATFVALAALPVTPNGKVDRQALPVPDFHAVATRYVAPTTPVEAVLAAIWGEVLRTPQVGVADNFFDLGGHSLLVTQILARVRTAFQVDLPVRALFEAATVAELARRIETAQCEQGQQVFPPPLQPTARTHALPLSFAQQRLWFLAQLEGPSATYNMPVALRLTGPLQVEPLQHALNTVVQRHEILRTTFCLLEKTDHDDTPRDATVAMQQIQPSMTVPLVFRDCQHLAAAAPHSLGELQQMLAQDADAPFDLTQGALLRVNLYRLGPDDHLLLVTMHHIIADGWSLDLWWQEVDACYQAALAGTAAMLPPLPIQYADFAVWQRQWLADPSVQAAHLAYWRQQLAGVHPLLELPTDQPRPSVQTFRGRTEGFTLAPEVVDGLYALSQQANASLFMTLLGAFSILLARYSRQTDLVIGTPIANRQQVEIESLIGFFVNTLPLRLNLAGAPTFLDLLAHIRQVTLDSYTHQAMPFEQLLATLDIPRSLSYPPLFQVMMTHTQARSGGVRLGELAATPFELDNHTAKFDLTLYWQEEARSRAQGASLQGAIEYNADLFSAATIRRMIGHLQQIIHSILTTPATPIHQLPLLTPVESQQLAAWNHTQQPYAQASCIHHLFEAQVTRTPDAVAVVFADEAPTHPPLALTYAELNRHANQLAHYLIEAGVGPDHLVGLCLPTSAQLIIGLLGILKAGAAYVPLDAGLPAARLAQMTQSGRIQMVLTSTQLADHLPTSLQCICLDRAAAQIAKADESNPADRACAQDLIYMIYTSGSTGTPKGAGVYHHSFVNLVQWFVHSFGLGAQDRVLITSSTSFDLTQKNFFAPLIVGGQVHLSSAAPYEYAALRQHIAQHEITWLNCAPSAFYPFIDPAAAPADDAAHFAALRSLRYLFLGGEPIALARLQPWLQSSRCQATLVNTYGPTECTDVVAAYPLHPADLTAVSAIPLGRPIPNATLHVLDEYQQPVPVGVPGELWIGGVCVGAGYLDDPNLTAAKFVTHVQGQPAPPHRLYRTGDLVQWRADGHLLFLGRLDNQVKVRGFRIELGEIEAALRRHPTVQEAVVVTVAHTEQATQLVAYMTLRSPHSPVPATTLRQHLQTQLPDYMLPAAFVVLDELPLTASGKIDRKRLPAVDPAQLSAAGESDAWVAPATPTEELLAAIWAELLGVGRVGRYHNFFTLGGHSLLAVQLVARLRTTCQIELPVRTVFEAPTLAALAEMIVTHQQAGTAAPHQSIPSLARQLGANDLPLSFAQQRLWFLQHVENAGTAYHIPTAFELVGALDAAALERALTVMVQRHEVLRTTFPSVAGTPVQRIHATLPLPLIQVDLQTLVPADQQATLHRLLRAEASHPFDFAQGPLLRVTLYRLQPNRAVLLVNIHHIIADDGSVAVWWRELHRLYQAFANGQAVTLPPLPIQYADFAQWQRSQLTGALLQQQLAYWQQQLAAAPSLLDLPTDRPRPATTSYHGASERFVLDADLVAALWQRCHTLAVTPFMLLQATFALLLARYSGQDDIVIGTPISQRQHRETEGLIGFFVNTLALRTNLAGNPPFADVLAAVRQTVLAAFDHADLPFERLVSALNLPHTLNHAPLFQVLFVWQQVLTTAYALGDLTVTPLPVEHTTAKFDLTLFLTETAHLDSAAGITGAFEYNTDLFDPTTIQRMVGHLTNLLTAIVANPMTPIRQLPLLSTNEQTGLLQQMNATPVLPPVNRCLHQLFEEQVRRTPDRLAVVFANQSLTYAELNARANQLAHYLQTLGGGGPLGADVIIGICLERSIDLMVGILAILKAGGAYLPVDASYPAERIAYMLTNAHAPLLLTQAQLAARLPATATRVLCLEEIWPRLDQDFATPANLDNPALPVTTENLLYLLYTSGSTGQPKGVAMPHRPLVNLIQWQLQQTDQAHAGRTLQFSPISFDVSCQEIFATWCAGGTLVLVSEAMRRDPYALLRYLVEQRVERLFLPFVALQQLAEAASKQPDLDFALCDVITAGEQLQITTAIAGWFGRMQARLHNHYGPTETHVITAYTLPADRRQWPLLPPIGRPVANCQVYVLDKEQQPVPIGVTGELYLGGAGVAHGYLNRTELTQERFLPNPWGAGQLYRSGDLGRYRADGQIEYLGRADNQIKVRGYRIDPGELEAVLSQHPTVQEVVVVALLDHEGHRQLVAYVVPASPPAGRDLRAVWRQHLQTKVPAYMLPTHLVALEQFPLTPSGKVDRHKLLTYQDFQPVLDSQAVAPQTALEKTIATVWQELLQIEAVSLHTNFFDVGGHSLLVVQLHDRLQQALGVELSITDLFQFSTIAALATHLTQAQPAGHYQQENQNRAQARRNALRQSRASQLQG